MSEDRGFLFASGKIVKDYSILRYYIEELKARNLSHEHIVPSSDTLESIRRKVMEKSYTVADIMMMLEPEIEGKIDLESASKAAERYLNAKVDIHIAKRMVARAIAGYYIEIADSLGYIHIKA